jgi:hypothetical protein
MPGKLKKQGMDRGKDVLLFSDDAVEDLREKYSTLLDIMEKDGYTIDTMKQNLDGFEEISKLIHSAMNSSIIETYNTTTAQIKPNTTPLEFTTMLYHNSKSALELFLETLKMVSNNHLPLYLLIGMKLCQTMMDLGTANLCKTLLRDFPFLMSTDVSWSEFAMTHKKYEA